RWRVAGRHFRDPASLPRQAGSPQSAAKAEPLRRTATAGKRQSRLRDRTHTAANTIRGIGMVSTLLRDVYESAAVAKSGPYYTSVNELCDQAPALRPEVLLAA